LRYSIQVWSGQVDSFPNVMIETGTGTSILGALGLDWDHRNCLCHEYGLVSRDTA
jgi:hypothetical protein